MTKKKHTKTSDKVMTAGPMAPLGTILRVRDIEKASKFYQHIGFVEDFTLPDSTGKIILAVLRFGTSSLLLGGLDELHYENPSRKKLIQKNVLGLGVINALVVPDIERVYEKVKLSNLTILLEPVDEYYGDRVFMFLDADGYEWKISQIIKNISSKEIKKIASNS